MPPTTHTRSRSSGTKSATLTPPTTGNITTMSFIRASVTAITLSQMDLDKIEILDRSKNNWSTWSDHMQNYLLLKHGGGYILGLVSRPDPSLQVIGT
jgi:hypothetical protein